MFFRLLKKSNRRIVRITGWDEQTKSRSKQQEMMELKGKYNFDFMWWINNENERMGRRAGYTGFSIATASSSF
jgi:hypothetical protein